jgi:hypothetical protein
VTAINIMVQRDAVHILSDGASYDAEQRFVSAGPKVFALPHINAAIGTRGPAVALPLLAHFVGHESTSYDELKANITKVLQNVYTLTSHILTKCVFGGRFEVVIGGISETTGPDAYMIACDADGVVSPITEIPELGFMPSSIQELHDFVTFTAMQQHAGSKVHPADFLLQAMEIQRSARFGEYDTCHIGAFAQITSIRADGIETKILRRWSDTIGMPLGGDAGSVFAALMALGKPRFCDPGQIRSASACLLEATAGAIDSLAVRSLNIGDNAVTVPVSQTLTPLNSTGTAGNQTAASFNVSVDTTGLAGKTFSVSAVGVATIGINAAMSSMASISISLTINGSTAQAYSFPSGILAPVMPFAGAVSITATGGVQTVPVTVLWNGGVNSPSIAQLLGGSISVLITKR